MRARKSEIVDVLYGLAHGARRSLLFEFVQVDPEAALLRVTPLGSTRKFIVRVTEETEETETEETK
jgi:hypothetical protein